jgi:aarF domain-containing kinase
MVPPEFEQILLRVQNSANYMPDSQLMKVMKKELGSDWQSKFSHFDLMPIAAASIGQVHKATIPNGEMVAVKVQYPGVAGSIESDLANLKALAMMSSFLPKGMYLDNTIKVARIELMAECDYEREADSMERFREMLHGSHLDALSRSGTKFNVPKVLREFSTRNVLTTEFVEGVTIGKILDLPQRKRDEVCYRLYSLCF